jgi:hypothetical protein
MILLNTGKLSQHYNAGKISEHDGIGKELQHYAIGKVGWFIVLNATFNNISGISWRSLDLQLSVQSVPITTKVASSNPVHDEVCTIQHYVIKLVTCDR